MSSCSGIRADGGRCRGQAIAGGQWCFSHHPDYEQARQRRASKGGKRGGRGRPLLEVHGVAEQLQELADRVLAGELDRQLANTAGQLLNVKLRALDIQREWRETEELAREVEEMRAMLETRKASRYG
jgi:hypothetical protein